MMYEVFNARTANTVAFVPTEMEALAMCENNDGKGDMWDYSKATPGFYVKRANHKRTEYTAQAFHSRDAAERFCSMRNMGDDFTTWSFVEVR